MSLQLYLYVTYYHPNFAYGGGLEEKMIYLESHSHRASKGLDWLQVQVFMPLVRVLDHFAMVPKDAGVSGPSHLLCNSILYCPP